MSNSTRLSLPVSENCWSLRKTTNEKLAVRRESEKSTTRHKPIKLEGKVVDPLSIDVRRIE